MKALVVLFCVMSGLISVAIPSGVQSISTMDELHRVLAMSRGLGRNRHARETYLDNLAQYTATRNVGVALAREYEQALADAEGRFTRSPFDYDNVHLAKVFLDYYLQGNTIAQLRGISWIRKFGRMRSVYRLKSHVERFLRRANQTEHTLFCRELMNNEAPLSQVGKIWIAVAKYTQFYFAEFITRERINSEQDHSALIQTLSRVMQEVLRRPDPVIRGASRRILTVLHSLIHEPGFTGIWASFRLKLSRVFAGSPRFTSRNFEAALSELSIYIGQIGCEAVVNDHAD